MALGAALGFTVSHGIGKRAAAKSTAELSAAMAAPSASVTGAAPVSSDAWVAKLEAINWDRPDGSRLAELEQALVNDPGLRAAVTNVYRAKTDPRIRAVLRRMLTADASPEMVSRSLELANSRDKQDRAAGFELIAELPPSAGSVALAGRALQDERDPAVLAAVLLAVRPRIPPSPAEIDDMLPRFLPFVGHEAPLVRAHSVQLVAEWDRNGKTSENIVAKALSDDAPLVRQAAVGAVMIGQIRSDRLKRGLLDIVRNPVEDIQTRFGAQQALERFDLSADEYHSYMQARQDIEKNVENLDESSSPAAGRDDRHVEMHE